MESAADVHTQQWDLSEAQMLHVHSVLQVEPDRLMYALTTRVLEMRGETITTKLTAEQVRMQSL